LRLAKRVEVRFPDPLANNPYPGFAAMLMAGLDGVKNEFDPENLDKNRGRDDKWGCVVARVTKTTKGASNRRPFWQPSASLTTHTG
jgi:hypothetical protein